MTLHEKQKSANWERIEKIGKVEHLSDEAMLALGSIYGQLECELAAANKVLEALVSQSKETIEELRDERDEARSDYRRLLNMAEKLAAQSNKVEVLKRKKGKPTVILFDGSRYIQEQQPRGRNKTQ